MQGHAHSSNISHTQTQTQVHTHNLNDEIVAQFDLKIPDNTQNHFNSIFNFNQQADFFSSASYRFYQNQHIDTLFSYDENTLQAVFEKLNDYQRQGYWAIGYISYEAFKITQHKNQQNQLHDLKKTLQPPLIYFKVFKAADISKVIDYQNTVHQFNGFNVDQAWQNINFQEFSEHIQEIQKQIHQGEVYQINYTHLFKQPVSNQFDEKNIVSYYHALGLSQKYRYSAYLKMDKIEYEKISAPIDIISHSPELFFAWDQQNIFTQPMKGTAKRSLNETADLLQKQQLQSSPKERAENIMIVDLLRNDLSQISQPHSIKVPQLLDCIALPSVWQMVSGICAQTQNNIKLYDIFKALFPCGSITGAPKVAAMNLIEKIEAQPRQIYCGAIGLLSPHACIFNVAIRTLWRQHNQWHYGVGSGITIDSNIEQEWQEWQNKMQFLKI